MNVDNYALPHLGAMLSTTEKMPNYQVDIGGGRILAEPEDADYTRTVTYNTVMTGGSQDLITYRSTVDQQKVYPRDIGVVQGHRCG